MSWNAHTDHIFNQSGNQIEFLQLCGPDGSVWGSSGTTACSYTKDTLKNAAETPGAGFMTKDGKYMFLRDMDSFKIFNLRGKGLAVCKGGKYVAIAIAAEGYKAEQCVTALEKLKAYLTTLGYN